MAFRPTIPAYSTQGKSFSRTAAFPLEGYEIWTDLEALKAYAANTDASKDPSYIGQKVAYVDYEGNRVVHYGIEIDGTLKELGADKMGVEALTAADHGKIPKAFYVVDTPASGEEGAEDYQPEVGHVEVRWVTPESFEDTNTVTTVEAADKSVEITTSKNDVANKDYKVKVNISEEEGNSLSLKADGLYVEVPEVVHPEYAVRKEEKDGFEGVYHLTKDGTDVDVAIEVPKVVIPEQTDYTVTCEDSDHEATADAPAFKRHTLKQLGKTVCTIDIPKELVVEEGSVKEVTEVNKPYTGAAVGDKYIELKITNQTDPLYIPAKDLVEYINVEDTATVDLTLDETHKLTAVVKISAEAGNSLVAKKDGLYVNAPILPTSEDAAVANQYVTAVDQKDGKVTVSRKQISYNELADLPTIPGETDFGVLDITGIGAIDIGYGDGNQYPDINLVLDNSGNVKLSQTEAGLKAEIIFKHETEADWNLSSYKPDEGEQIIYDPDIESGGTHSSPRLKIGNGKDIVKDLPFATLEGIENKDGAITVDGELLYNGEEVATKSDLENIDAGVTSVNGKTGAVTLKASDVGADVSGAATSAVSEHNSNLTSHADMREQIVQLTSEVNELDERVSILEATAENSDGLIIPSYWQEHLNERVEDIRRAMESAGRNKSAFFFYSDAHWSNDDTYTAKFSPTLLRYLYTKTSINKTNYGGDIVSAESADTDIMAYLWDWREQLRNLPNHHSVIGNHDDGNTTDRLLSKDYVYAYLFAPEETNDIVWGEDFYYYIDNVPEKTRYLYLDIFYSGITLKQQSFVKEALKTTPAYWHIVVVSHALFDNDYGTTENPIYPPILKGLATEMQPIYTMLDAYNARTGDFSNCAGKVELCVGGHYHLDHYDYTDGGIPCVIVEADTIHNRSGAWPQKGTIDESAVSAVICDYNTEKVNIIRVGRGNSYTVDMNGGGSVTTYSITNNLTNCTNSNSATRIMSGESYYAMIYADDGYNLDTVTVTMGGVDITSSVFIDGSINIDSVTGNIVVTAIASVTDEPDVSYTNVMPLSIDKDGQPFADGKGWMANSRVGSGGIYAGNQTPGTDGAQWVTGHIPITLTESHDIYLKNVTFDSTSTNGNHGVFFFDENFAKISPKDTGTPTHLTIEAIMTYMGGSDYLDENGNITKLEFRPYSTTNNPAVKYFCICCGGLSDESIITIDEEIQGDGAQEDDPSEDAYTNVIPLSIGDDGNPFNGGKGWADKSRIGSGGIYLGTSTSYVTGHIEIDPNIDNTFYLKNVIFDATTNDAPDGSYRYFLAPFDESFKRINFNTDGGDVYYGLSDFANHAVEFNTVIEDNNIVQFTLYASTQVTNKNVKYVALCCSYLGDDSIITINEQIPEDAYTNLFVKSEAHDGYR